MTRIIALSETSDPTAVANQVIVYSKDVAGVSKLYVMLSDSTAIELGAGGGGMAIGGAITSATEGSVLFAGVGGILQQDNANLFWDNTNNWLGIGTNGPDAPLTVIGAANFYAGTVQVNNGGSLYIEGPGELRTDQIQHFTAPGGSTAIDIMVPISVRGGIAKFWGPTFNTEGHIYLDPRDSPSQPSIGFQWDTNATATGFINDRGYQAGTTQFRDLKIRDGKGVDVVTVTGSSKQVDFAGAVIIATNLTVGGSSSDTLDANCGLLKLGASSDGIVFMSDNNQSYNFGFATNGAHTGYINNTGYQDGITQFRSLIIADGKAAAIATFTGSTKRTDLAGALGQKAHANFAGSDQVSTTAAVQTTNATQTTIFTLTLPDTSDTWIEARVVARDTAGTERAVYGKLALVFREGGGATIQGSVQDVFTDVETSAGLDATFTVSSNDVRLSVTGLAATTINWAASITYQTVSGSA